VLPSRQGKTTLVRTQPSNSYALYSSGQSLRAVDSRWHDGDQPNSQKLSLSGVGRQIINNHSFTIMFDHDILGSTVDGEFGGRRRYGTATIHVLTECAWPLRSIRRFLRAAAYLLRSRAIGDFDSYDCVLASRKA
jgi:hypothetical protein